MGGVLRHSDALMAKVVYYRFGPEDFAIVLTTRYTAQQRNRVIASVLGHHFLDHAPLLVLGGGHEVLCTREGEIAGLEWADRFLAAADEQHSTTWKQRVMRARYSSGEPT